VLDAEGGGGRFRGFVPTAEPSGVVRKALVR
jgi:hypothetical protein